MKDKDKAKGMLLPVDCRQQVELLTDAEAGLLFKALLAYSDAGAVLESENRVLAVVFAGLRSQIDAAAGRYADKCEKNRAIALERERRKREQKQEHERTRTCTNVNERERTSTNKIKENKEKENNNIKKSFAKKSAAVDVPKFIEYFNSVLARHGAIIKPVQSVTDQRRAAVEARARENGKASLQTVAMKAAKSNFLNGENDRSWLATFDWLMRPSNFAKVLEGNFDNDATAKAGDKKVNELWK